MTDHLLGLTLAHLRALCAEQGLPAYAAAQMAKWIYQKGATDLAQMTDLSLANRARLATLRDVGRVAPKLTLTAADNTRKLLFDYGPGRAIETALIPDERTARATVCVSSQCGCKMGCHFCATGQMGFRGQLTAGEMINQVAEARLIDLLGDLPKRQLSGRESDLTNVVFMGMGEPLDNYEALRDAIDILTAPWGYAWSPRRITVSTIGPVDNLRRLLDETQVNVALSLHFATPELRAAHMPVEKAHPADDALRLLSDYDWRGQRRLTFEVTLFNGVNDTQRHSEQLAQLLRGWPALVNLIPFNDVCHPDLKPSPRKRMEAVRDLLNARGLNATIRESKGADINAACGLLATARTT